MTTLYPPIRPYSNMQQQTEQELQEMSLREHLIAAAAGQGQSSPLQPHTPHAPGQHIDPQIQAQQYAMAAAAGSDNAPLQGTPHRNGRVRELSNSKRAAQNRAAQRAFRQRKEEYIKSLEAKVKERDQLYEQYRNVDTENFQLREYIINIQRLLLEKDLEMPSPPPGLSLDLNNISRHREVQPPAPNQSYVPQAPQQPEQQPTSHDANNNGGLSEHQVNELQMAAQAAAAAQGPSVDTVNHQSQVGSYDANARKDDSTGAGQPFPTYYPTQPNYEPAQNAHP